MRTAAFDPEGFDPNGQQPSLSRTENVNFLGGLLITSKLSVCFRA
jgi:hypothetical protein